MLTRILKPALRVAILAILCIWPAGLSRAGTIVDFQEVMRLFRVDEFKEAAAKLNDIASKITPQEARVLRAAAGSKMLAQMAVRPELYDGILKIAKVAHDEDLRLRQDTAYMQKLADSVLSSDGAERQAALEEIRLQGAYAVPYLVNLMKDGQNAEQRAKIISVLEMLGPRATFPLAAALDSGKYYICENVLIALGQTPDPQAVPYLLKFARKTDNSALKGAAEKLAKNLAVAGRVPMADSAAPFNWLARAFMEYSPLIEVDQLEDQLPLWRWEGSLTFDLVSQNIYYIRSGMRLAWDGIQIAPGDLKLLATLGGLLINERLVAPQNSQDAALRLHLLGPDVLLLVVDDSLRSRQEGRLNGALAELNALGSGLLSDSLGLAVGSYRTLLRVLTEGPDNSHPAALQAICRLAMLDGMEPAEKALYVDSLSTALSRNCAIRRAILLTPDPDFGNRVREWASQALIEVDVVADSKSFEKAAGAVPTPVIALVHTQFGKSLKEKNNVAKRSGLRTAYIGPDEKRKEIELEGGPAFEFLAVPATPKFLGSFILGSDQPKIVPEALSRLLEVLAEIPAAAIAPRRGEIAENLNNVLGKLDGELRLAAIGQLARLGDFRSFSVLINSARSSEMDPATREAAMKAIGDIARRTGKLPDQTVIEALFDLAKADSPVSSQAISALGLLPRSPQEAWKAFVRIYPQPQAR